MPGVVKGGAERAAGPPGSGELPPINLALSTTDDAIAVGPVLRDDYLRHVENVALGASVARAETKTADPVALLMLICQVASSAYPLFGDAALQSKAWISQARGISFVCCSPSAGSRWHRSGAG